MLLDHCTGIVPGSPQQLVRFPWEVLKKKKSMCACEMLSQNKTSAPFPLLSHPACCRPALCCPSLQQDAVAASVEGPNETVTHKYVTFFAFARGINQKEEEEKKDLLAQGSGLFIFLPAATCYPLRGSRKTSHGLGWSDMSNPNCRPGPSQ